MEVPGGNGKRHFIFALPERRGVGSHSPDSSDAVSVDDHLQTAVAELIKLISPTVAVNLAWTGADADNDIVDHDVYFDIIPIPTLYKLNVTSLFLNNVAVTRGIAYDWKIITRDIAENASDSGIFQFKVYISKTLFQVALYYWVSGLVNDI
jgi:hypothetical protein